MYSIIECVFPPKDLLEQEFILLGCMTLMNQHLDALTHGVMVLFTTIFPLSKILSHFVRKPRFTLHRNYFTNSMYRKVCHPMMSSSFLLVSISNRATNVYLVQDRFDVIQDSVLVSQQEIHTTIQISLCHLLLPLKHHGLCPSV